MNNNYAFKLTPAFCLYNGVAVVKQNGSKINFLMDNDNSEIKERMDRAFRLYLNNIKKMKDCPNDYFFTPEVRFTKGTRQQLKKCVSELFQISDISEKKEIEQNKEDSEAAAVILLDTIINEATSKNATDIHIEKNSVKFRVNGKIETNYQLDRKRSAELIQRIKFLAGLNVLDKHGSQDGSFVYGVDRSLYIRVSTMSVIGNSSDVITEDFEESVVLRLLDTKRIPLCLEKLGFNNDQYSKLVDLCYERSGLILICGSTGVGKSTTAAALLLKIRAIRKNQIKIISVEDPAEYVIPGVTQIQVNKDNPMSQVLKYIFRQDPDVLMIGEIRDEKSANVAIRAALTGHLVIATLHTTSAATSIYRLADLGIKQNILGTVLKGVVVQQMDDQGESLKFIANVGIPEKGFEYKLSKLDNSCEIENLFSYIKSENGTIIKKTKEVFVQ